MLNFHPLTPDRWDDFTTLFGAKGACGGCWCMSFRLSRPEFEANKGEPNRAAMQEIVSRGDVPGIVAYDGEQPIGWCAVAPREVYTRLARARSLRPIDEQPVWSVVCFFVAKSHRRQGVSVAILEAAADYVRSQGGRILEGYPVDPSQEYPPPFAFNGILAAFLKAGFVEVRRPSATRAIVRRVLKK